MDSAKQLLAIVLLVGCAYVLISSFGISGEHQEKKYDLAVINDARYGLFNIDTWKKEIKAVLVQQVSEFELTGDNRDVVKQQVESMLHTLVDEVQESLKNMEGFDRIKGLLANVVINFSKIREDIPKYAESIIADLENEENMEALRESILTNIDQWVLVEDSAAVETPQTVILEKYGCDNVAACNDKLKGEIQFVHERLWIYTALAMVFAFLVYLILFFSDDGKFPLYILAAASTILLAGGLTLPMLDLQAGMDDIQFTIMGETIAFKHQVLFFQSKSIVDVVVTLFRSATFNGILVGFLILLFSVLFPVSKLIASLVYILSDERPKNSFSNFLVFKSGKWSMADVFVVAVFMSFLGFSGLINSQLANMPQSENFHSVAFNASVFQPGFAWFIAFCLSGLFLSLAIEKRWYE
jgi:hypothetical protein